MYTIKELLTVDPEELYQLLSKLDSDTLTRIEYSLIDCVRSMGFSEEADQYELELHRSLGLIH